MVATFATALSDAEAACHARVCAEIASARGATLELEGIDSDTREAIDYEDYWWMHYHGWGVDDYRTTGYARASDILRRIEAAKQASKTTA